MEQRIKDPEQLLKTTIENFNELFGFGKKMKEIFEDIKNTLFVNLRRINDVKDKYYVYSNQVACAIEIICMFLLGHRFVTLYAPMQSGKTGVINTVLHILYNNVVPIIFFLVKNVAKSKKFVWITAYNSNQWKDQTAHRADQQITSDLSYSEIRRRCSHMVDLATIIKKSKNGELPKEYEYIKNIIEEGNAIIIVDESHIGHFKGSTVDNMFKLFGISGNGDPEKLQKRNNYVISVSATPYQENINDENRNMVSLKITDDYYGLYDMNEEGKIKSSYSLRNSENRKKLREHIKYDFKGKNGYVIIRAKGVTHNKFYNECLNDGINVVRYDSDYKTRDGIYNFDDYLSKNSEGITVVLVKDFLRVAQTLKKEALRNIIFTFDTHNAKADTAVQSLIGRCCNYHNIRHIIHYVNYSSCLAHIAWEYHNKEKNMTPNNANGIENGAKTKIYKKPLSDWNWVETLGLSLSNIPEEISNYFVGQTNETVTYCADDMGLDKRRVKYKNKKSVQLRGDILLPLIELVKKDVVTVHCHKNFLGPRQTPKEKFLEVFDDNIIQMETNPNGNIVPYRFRRIKENAYKEISWANMNKNGELVPDYGAKKKEFEEGHLGRIKDFESRLYLTGSFPVEFSNNPIMKKNVMYLHLWKAVRSPEKFKNVKASYLVKTIKDSLSHISNS